jgi:Predicted transcriptional regulator
MESVKLFDSELKLMELMWEHEPISAKELSLLANNRIGWNKNTTYTVLKKLIEKGVIKRDEPNFMCSSQIKKEEIQKAETASLIEKLYSGSKKAFFAAFLENETISKEELSELKALIDKR